MRAALSANPHRLANTLIITGHSQGSGSALSATRISPIVWRCRGVRAAGSADATPAVCAGNTDHIGEGPAIGDPGRTAPRCVERHDHLAVDRQGEAEDRRKASWIA